MARIGFLHTAQVHVDTFSGLVDEQAGTGSDSPKLTSHHLVRPELLEYARINGIDEHLKGELRRALDELAASHVDVIVCTCSTISGAAERSSSTDHVEVVRIDRPMATEAITRASQSASGTIAVVTAVDSAAAPALELLDEEAAEHGSDPTIESVFCDGAWAHFEAGDNDRFLTSVATEIDQIDPAVAVVMIAQASMAGAAEKTSNPARVLTSPALAVAAAINHC